MMPVVRISEDTWARLQQHAVPFEDKPEDVIRKALDALEQSSGVRPHITRKRNPKRIVSNEKTPQKAFRLPLMEAISELGGSADVRDIRPLVRSKVEGSLKEADFEKVSTGEERWWNAACWERNDLRKEGLLESNTPRGVWGLSRKGESYLHEAKKANPD